MRFLALQLEDPERHELLDRNQHDLHAVGIAQVAKNQQGAAGEGWGIGHRERSCQAADRPPT